MPGTTLIWYYFWSVGRCPSGQRERAVNPSAFAYEGSNPSRPTTGTRSGASVPDLVSSTGSFGQLLMGSAGTVPRVAPSSPRVAPSSSCGSCRPVLPDQPTAQATASTNPRSRQPRSNQRRTTQENTIDTDTNLRSRQPGSDSATNSFQQPPPDVGVGERFQVEPDSATNSFQQPPPGNPRFRSRQRQNQVSMRCMMTASSQAPNLRPTSRSVPTTSNPQARCNAKLGS